MSLLRFLLFLLVGMMGRRLFMSFRKANEIRRRQETENVRTPREVPKDNDLADLTEQGIDDADFEEIP